MTLTPATSRESGGGFAIGSSYLVADSIDQPGLADGNFVLGRWSLHDSSGSDISIDGGDDTKIHIATAGWYSVAAWANLGPETGGANLQFTQFGMLINGALTIYPVTQGLYQPDDFNILEWTLPDGEFAAGDVLTFRAVAVVSAGTWDFFGPVPQALWIVRHSP